MRRRTLIRAIYRKELLDILRDRRTLLAMIVIPVVLYPLLMLGLYRAAESEQARLESERFRIEVPDEATRELLSALLADVGTHRTGPPRKLPDFEWRVGSTPKQKLGEDLQARVEARPRPATAPAPQMLDIEITYNEVNIRSRTAMEQLREVLREYGEMLTRRSLEQLLPPLAQGAPGVEAILKPIGVETVSAATEQQRGGWALGQIIPIILVLMTITGAVYPAIDLTAGERERGTLETLMVTPVPVLHLIVGKFLVVATIALVTAALNVASVGATMHFSGLMRALSAEMPVQFPLSALPIILVCLVPFALLFAAVLIAVCSFARTFKEAQNYVMPVIILAMMPAFATSLPGVRLQGIMLVLPVGNMVLLARELFQQTYSVSQIIVVVLSTTLYAAAAVAAAAKIFGQEAVVFSDSRSYKTLLNRRYFAPASAPTAAQALLLIALLFPASFYAQSLLGGTSSEDFLRLMRWLAVVQFGGLFVLLPAAVSAWLKIDLVRTFRLRLPPLRSWPAALLIGSSSWALAQAALWLQQRVTRPSSALEEFGRQIEAQLAGHPFWLVVLLLAIVPAVSEELLFRGFLLSGLSGMRKWSAIVLAGAVFGVYHFILDRVPVTAMMGILLGYICWQSRSVWPGMLVHAMHNAAAMVLLSDSGRVARWLRLDVMPEGSLLPARVLLPAAVLLLMGLGILATLRRSHRQAADPLREPEPARQ